MKKLKSVVLHLRAKRDTPHQGTDSFPFAYEHAELMQASNAGTMSKILSLRAQSIPDSPLIAYPDKKGFCEIFTARELNSFAHRAAEHYAQTFPSRSSSTQKPRVIGLLGPADFEFIVTMYSLWLLGHTVVLLSPRLATVAYVHVLTEAGAHGVIYSKSFSKTMTEISHEVPHMISEVLFSADSLRQPTPNGQNQQIFTFHDCARSDDDAVIIHSSGSTGLPKPNALTHRALLNAASKNLNMEAFCCVPFFHGFGLNSLNRAVFSGKRITLCNATVPMTWKHLTQIIWSEKPEVVFCVPHTLKLLSESQEGIDAMKTCNLIWFAGSACPDELGDHLTAQGVKLISDYGLSECGPLMNTMRPDGDTAWNYLRPYPHVLPFIRWVERSPGTFELICLPGMTWMQIEDRSRDYATNDLFEKHPTIKNAYKFVARQDDTIVLSNGEKFRPSDLEGRIRHLEWVSEAFVFGAGQPEAGIAVMKSIAADSMADDELLDKIWPLIQNECSKLPSHGRISREMVLLLQHNNELPQTLKGTVIRQQFHRKFQHEIDNMYEANDETTKLSLEADDLRKFVRKELARLLEDSSVSFNDETDVFQLGLNSLQSTRLRRTLQTRLDLKGARLPLNLVYEHPSVNQLSGFLISVASNTAQESSDQKRYIGQFLDKYGDLSLQPSRNRKHVLALTGTTGSLGAHILAQLIGRDDVSTVYCFVRKSAKATAQQRVMKALEERKLKALLTQEDMAKLVALSVDLSQPFLGLTDDEYATVAQRLTIVIHAAWSVNFNLSLSSFEPDIKGTRHLIDLCLASKDTCLPTFAFCSSISTMLNSDILDIKEIASSEATAIDMGYAYSKLVAEEICNRASDRANLKTYILRIGQIAGDTQHGRWNSQESIPMMLRTAEDFGMLPELHQNECRWLPVNLVASIVTEISLSSGAAGGSVFNVINPSTFNFSADLIPKLRRAGLSFEETSVEVWLSRLRRSDPDTAMNPSIKLLPFFEHMYSKSASDREDANTMAQSARNYEWATSNCARYSETFRAGWKLDQDFVDKMINFLRSEAWTPSGSSRSNSSHFV